MLTVMDFFLTFAIAAAGSLFGTPLVKKLAVKIGAMDIPDYRKIHKNPTPRLGGVAIFTGVVLALLYIRPIIDQMWAITLGAVIIIITGILDDKYQLRPVMKLAGQILAAGLLIYAGLVIERITIPVFGMIPLGYFSIAITFLWIVGITNAINLIDGLDGLASGVTSIALTSIMVMAIIDHRTAVVYLCIALIGSNIGFLYHNFYPAKIYMGDTGSMFLGYSVAVISIVGLFKHVTLFSFIIPIIVLAVPIFDTLFAIVRRWSKGESIMHPDKYHIHYQLLATGFSHRTTVLIIYGISAIFGVLAIFFSYSTIGISLLITGILLFLLQIFAEFVGVGREGRRPVLRAMRKLYWKLSSKFHDR